MLQANQEIIETEEQIIEIINIDEVEEQSLSGDSGSF